MITAGPWASQTLDGIVPLRVTRQVMAWIQPKTGVAQFLPDRFPVFLCEDPEGGYPGYGFPAMDGPEGGVKAAIHGSDVSCTPDTVDRVIHDADVRRIIDQLEVRMPSLDGKVVRAKTCLYTMTPDEHFVIGPHPRFAACSIACGFSGHGFKFASVVGEILADLAMRERLHIRSHYLRRRDSAEVYSAWQVIQITSLWRKTFFRASRIPITDYEIPGPFDSPFPYPAFSVWHFNREKKLMGSRFHFHVIATFLIGAMAGETLIAQTITTTPPVAYVYVSRPTHLDGFAASPSGKLTPVPGSPFSNIAVSHLSVTNKFLFGAGDDNESLFSYAIASNGSVRKVGQINTHNYNPGGAPCDTVGPTQVDFARKTVYNNDSRCEDTQYIQQYKIESSGQLTFLGNTGTDSDQLSMSNPVVLGNDQYVYVTASQVFIGAAGG